MHVLFCTVYGQGNGKKQKKENKEQTNKNVSILSCLREGLQSKPLLQIHQGVSLVEH